MKKVFSMLMAVVLVLGVCLSTPLSVTADAAKANTTLATPVAKAGNTAKGIKLSWNKISGAKKYVVYQRFYIASIKEWSAWQAIKTTASTSYVDTSVILGVNYRYAVRAVSGNTKGKYKSTGTVKYDFAPTVKVSNASNGVKVSWCTVANSSGYTVYSSTYNESTKKWSSWKNRGTASADRTSWVDKNVKSGVAYKYTVRAGYDRFKTSYNKSGVSIRFFAQPTVKVSNYTTGMKVTWSKISGAKSYAIYRMENANGSWGTWKLMGNAQGNKSLWIDKGVKSGVSYKYTVRAVSGKHKSAYKASNVMCFLSAPAVTAINGDSGVNVTWTQSYGASEYAVYRSVQNLNTGAWSGWQLVSVKDMNTLVFVDANTEYDTCYKYTVRAVNGDFKSAYVSSAPVQTESDPCEHIFTEATCTTPATCTICGRTRGEALGHTFVSGACEVCGERCVHSYQDATCTSPIMCTICGVTMGEALGHSYNSDSVCTRCGEKDLILADPFAAYQKAAQEINKKGIAGYTKKSWQTLDYFDCSGSMGSMISSLINGFMTPAEEAEDKVCGKGSDEAKRRMPLSDCSKRYVKSATAVKSGDIYTVTIVMKSQTNPSFDDDDGLARMTNDFLDIKDVEAIVSDDPSVSKIINNFSGSVKYDDYTIKAKMNSKGEFMSIEHSGVGQVNAQFTMNLAGNTFANAYIAFNGKYYDFKY